MKNLNSSDIPEDRFDSASSPGALGKWATAEEFYRERDNRTALEVERLSYYAVRPVEIWLSPDISESDEALQQAALLLCNLTARWARNVTVYLDRETALAETLARDGYKLLGERILGEMRSADPFGRFRTADYPAVAANESRPALRVFVGPWSDISSVNIGADPDDYFIEARGWSVFGKRGAAPEKPVGKAAVVPAAALAAALGAADLFKRAIEHPADEWMPEIFGWNLWNQDFTNSESSVDKMRTLKTTDLPESYELDLGRTLLAGAGAIGSALVYLLDFMKLQGKLVVLDRDLIETSNLNRSPLFNVAHVIGEAKKTSVAADYLSRHKIETDVLNGTWQEHAGQISPEPFDQWISLTNEDGAWATVPYLLPPVVFHGTTTSGWGFGAGRHLPRYEDCTLCRMPHPEIKFRGVCAQGEIQDKTTDKLAASASLPFLSAASAALLLAEIIKMSMSLKDSHLAEKVTNDYNEIAADLRFGLTGIMPLKRLSNPACKGCRAVKSEKWAEFGGRSRYGFLSGILTLKLGFKAA